MERVWTLLLLFGAVLAVPMAAMAAEEGTQALGNVDGTLHWQRRELRPGDSWTVSLALVSAPQHAELAKVVGALRGAEAVGHPADGPVPTPGSRPVVVANSTTDFALDAQGRFFWESGRRQMLKSPYGGQLSRFVTGISYVASGKTTHVFAGVASPSAPVWRVIDPIRAVSPRELRGELETMDKLVRLKIRAVLPGKTSGVLLSYTVIPSGVPLRDVRFSAYANLEAAHTHEGDYAQLDGVLGGMVCHDPTTGACVAMVGISRCSKGYVGTWPSAAPFRDGVGVERSQWPPFELPKAAVLKALSRSRMPMAVAPVPDKPKEPETVSLSAPAAAEMLEKDWLAQSGGAIDQQTVLDEIEWAEDLAKRIGLGEAAELVSLRKIAADVSGSEIRPAATPENLPGKPAVRWSFEGPREGMFAGEIKATGRWRRGAGVFGRAALLGPTSVLEVGAGKGRFASAPYTVAAWMRSVSQEADVLGNGTAKGSVLLMSYRGVARAHHWATSGLTLLNGKSRIDDGKWHHLAQVSDGKELRLYVDGKLEARGPLRGELCSSDEPLYVGWRGSDHRASRFVGALDEVAVYHRAVTVDELAGEVAIGRQVSSRVPEDLRVAYLTVRRLKRKLFLRHPGLDFDEIVFLDQPYPQGREWPHQARHRDGMMAMPGGRILALKGLRPDGAVRKLAPSGRPGAFWRFDLSFDGQRMLFCMKPWNDKAFHLYERDLTTGAVRQLTSGDYDDTDPIYLPDGHIMFTTSRCNTYVRCMPYTYSYVLARCDADGGNIYLVSRNNEPDWLPALLSDGRVIYSRWEYHDKALWRIQSLWTVNPDGTNVTAFWGNQSVWPDHLAEPRPIPGSTRVMFTGLAHHDWFAGSIGILDPRAGSNFPHGLTKVTAEIAWPECGSPPKDPIEKEEYHASSAYTAYKTPYPLAEDLFLVSARRGGRGGKFVLLLMDLYGNRELVYEGTHNIWHAMPLKARPRPPVMADRVAWPDLAKPDAPRKPGILYSNNVTYGVPELARGEVKHVRVIQMDARTYSLWNRDSGFSGPRTSLVQTDGVRRILGTAPVGADGSVCFEVPPGQALHFQVLDGEYRALQTMRSFSGAMPGETRGCLGCHESHSKTPVSGKSMALRRVPEKLTPPPWGTRSLSYERMIQPLFDRNCGTCHQGEGKARKKLDLTLRPGLGPFKEPYVTLVGVDGHAHKQIRQGPGARIACPLPAENYGLSDPESYVTFRPKTYLALRSPLREIAASGKHHGVKMTGDDLRLLTAWLDANCTYRSDEDVRELADPDFPGIESLPIRPRTKTAPRIPRP